MVRVEVNSVITPHDLIKLVTRQKNNEMSDSNTDKYVISRLTGIGGIGI
jgi:hypothetical protein